MQHDAMRPNIIGVFGALAALAYGVEKFHPESTS